jgi:hypothetical protein
MRPVRTISREVVPFEGLTPQRPHAGPRLMPRKIWSGLHGDMQRSAEMTDPLGVLIQSKPSSVTRQCG